MAAILILFSSNLESQMRFLNMKSFSVINGQIIDYPTPVVGYMSSLGSLSGLCLVIQILTGVLLTAHYTPQVALAFTSVEHIMRDVNDGWLFRYYHSNGASIFFLCIYLHIDNNSEAEAEDMLWISGLALYLAIMATAFMGYMLPWGQMSFWGATVITNLFAALPMIGGDIAQWLWGGFSVDNPTLNRFFSFHYLLPFIILALVILHLSLLHLDESSNDDDEYVEFYYYYFIKDLFAFFVLLIFFSYLVFFNPDLLSHPDNYIPAIMSVTPEHLVPEWYFLPYYSVLRSTPDKLGGFVLMFITIFDMFILNSLDDDDSNEIEGDEYDDAHVDEEEDGDTWALLLLFFLGGKDVEEPYTDIATLLTFLQFLDYFEFEETGEEDEF
jgi:quinol-cytochrome oxidoreductase complex cytochrome b subunit